MNTTDKVEIYIRDNFDVLATNPNLNIAGLKFTGAECLSGGLTNYVYRLKFANDAKHVSHVLKYFPPYLSCDVSYTISQDRYFIEKAALALFTDLSLSHKSGNSFTARTPRLLHHDDANYALIMEDAGTEAKPFFDLLKLDAELPVDAIADLALEIRHFIEFVTDRSQVTAHTHPVFESKAMNQVYNNWMNGVWAEKAKLFGLEREIEPYLAQRGHMLKPVDVDRDKVVFTFGDLWPNSMLVDVKNRVVWFIDWESARFQLDPMRDIEQLLCNLWLMKQNGRLFASAKIGLLMEELQVAISGDRRVDWRSVDERRKAKFVLWILSLLKEPHWGFEDPRGVMVRGLSEVAN